MNVLLVHFGPDTAVPSVIVLVTVSPVYPATLFGSSLNTCPYSTFCHQSFLLVAVGLLST